MFTPRETPLLAERGCRSRHEEIEPVFFPPEDLVMTSLPHASGLPQRQPNSPSGSHSGSRRHKDAFPPPPKTVRIWQVQAQSQEPSPEEPPPAENQPASGHKTQPGMNLWVLLFLAGLLGLAAWLFVFQFK